MWFSENWNKIRWGTIVFSFFTISFILWNTYAFFQKFKEEERIKVENFALAQKELGNIIDLNGDISDFPLKIVQSNTTTPMIIEDYEGHFQSKNIDQIHAKDTIYLRKLSLQYKKINTPIEIKYEGRVLSTIYYGNSSVLNKLKYYPLAFILIIVLFCFVVFFFYRSSKIATQNKLWSGMAKETAHQIGTPLSSLIGWTQLIKSEDYNNSYVSEIEKDIERLKTITNRFSKIGSLPVLKANDIVGVAKNTLTYLKDRSSKHIHFDILLPRKKIMVQLNDELFSWTIENLVKNGIDAMKGRGAIQILIDENDTEAILQVSDSGVGIEKKAFRTVFEPGYTTKKRGWGLGLSLSKRIIHDYHKGKIKILKSELNKGTTIEVRIKKSHV
jgi:hypothetical protein